MAFNPGDRVITECHSFGHGGKSGTVLSVTHNSDGTDVAAVDLGGGKPRVCYVSPANLRPEVVTFKVGDRVVTSCDRHKGQHGTVRLVDANLAGGHMVGLDDGDICFPLPGQLASESKPKRLDKALNSYSLAGMTNPAPKPERSNVLADADKIINGARQAEYGPPAVNFQRIADMWHVLFPERKWTPGDVARALAAVKLARSVQGFSRDTAVDLAGYAALYAELEKGSE